MNKVLIISSPFFGYQESVGRAFRDLGYEVRIETYDEPIHPFRGLLKWRHKFARNKEKLRAKSRAKYNVYIKQVYDHYDPAIVFIYNGAIIEDATLDIFRIKSKVAIWMYDSVHNPRYSRCKTHIDHVDAFFCFEKKDVDYYEQLGKKAYFLPLACDPYIYYPMDIPKEIDILFVGNIYGNQKRIELLNLLVKRYPEKKILIYGPYKPFYKNPVKWMFRTQRSIFKNINIPPQQVNELFNRSRIALNIHHQQTINGANQRVFEACGAGAYQVCDKNPFIASVFSHGEVGLYQNEEELIERIEDALQNDKSQQAKQGYHLILADHTFRKRIETILNTLESQ